MIRLAINKQTTRAELGAMVQKIIKEDLKDDPVLVGGAAVSIYTENRYQSDDLDLVTWRDNRAIKPVMEKFGFIESGSFWEHPDTDLLIQFVNSPVQIGRKHVKTAERMQTPAGELAIISALDSACDRLAWFLNDNDAQALEQCVDVIATQGVPLPSISRWLEGEPYPEETKRRAMALLKKKVARRKRR